MAAMLNILLWDLGTKRPEYNEPLGIEMLTAALNDHASKVRVILRWENAISDPGMPHFDGIAVVGLSVKSGSLPLLARIIAAIRELPRPPVIVLGDALSTFAFREVLALFPEVICVIGEGETAFRMIIENILELGEVNRESLVSIPNLAFASEGNVVLTNRFREITATLFTPDRRFSRWTLRQRGILRVEGSRGCSWSRCQFCCIKSKYGSGDWRPFPISYMVQQLAEISSIGGRGPYFTDEDFFGGDLERAVEFSESVIAAKADRLIAEDLTFLIAARVNDIVSPGGWRALCAMKDAGLREVFVGLESGSSNQLRRYGKLVTSDLNKQALGNLRDLGLEIDIGYILFEPEMTFEELRRNAAYLYELNLCDHYARLTKELRVLPFTGLAKKYARKGIISNSLDLETLQYPADYKDERVAWVREKLEEFESEGMHDIYRLQAACRGEGHSCEARLLAKRALGQIRAIDHDHLHTLIEYSAGRVPIDVMQSSADRQTQHRNQLLARCLQGETAND